MISGQEGGEGAKNWDRKGGEKYKLTKNPTISPQVRAKKGKKRSKKALRGRQGTTKERWF